MIEAVIFDWGNVLGKFNPSIAFNKLAVLCGRNTIEVELILQSLGLKELCETGKISEEQLCDEVCKVLGIRGLGLESFIEIWGDIVYPYAGCVDVISRVPARIPKFVLSNTEPSHWRYIQRLPVMKFFSDPTQQILSFDVGYRKPSREIFLEGVRRTGLGPDAILYIDDIVEFTNVFSGIGGNTAVYNCNVDTVHKLESILDSFGALSE